jgi:hypothetical protein
MSFIVLFASAPETGIFLGQLVLSQDGLEASDVPTELTETPVVLQLTSRMLKAQVEQLFIRLRQPLFDLLDR